MPNFDQSRSGVPVPAQRARPPPDVAHGGAVPQTAVQPQPMPRTYSAYEVSQADYRRTGSIDAVDPTGGMYRIHSETSLDRSNFTASDGAPTPSYDDVIFHDDSALFRSTTIPARPVIDPWDVPTTIPVDPWGAPQPVAAPRTVQSPLEQGERDSVLSMVPPRGVPPALPPLPTADISINSIIAGGARGPPPPIPSTRPVGIPLTADVDSVAPVSDSVAAPVPFPRPFQAVADMSESSAPHSNVSQFSDSPLQFSPTDSFGVIPSEFENDFVVPQPSIPPRPRAAPVAVRPSPENGTESVHPPPPVSVVMGPSAILPPSIPARSIPPPIPQRGVPPPVPQTPPVGGIPQLPPVPSAPQIPPRQGNSS